MCRICLKLLQGVYIIVNIMMKLNSRYIRYFVVGILLASLAFGSFGLIRGLATEAPRGLIPISEPECITGQNCEKPNIICPNKRIGCPQETDKIGNHIISDRGLINPVATEPCPQDVLSSQGDTQIRRD